VVDVCVVHILEVSSSSRVTLLETCCSSFHSLLLLGVPEADKWQTE